MHTVSVGFIESSSYADVYDLRTPTLDEVCSRLTWVHASKHRESSTIDLDQISILDCSKLAVRMHIFSDRF